MVRIDSSTQLATMIRAQFGARVRAQGGGHVPPSASAGMRRDLFMPDVVVAQPAGGGTSLEQMVASRVRAIAPHDPQRPRKAFRVFLESVLLQAFGAKHLDGGDLDALVDTVLERMDDEPELHAALREAGDLLLADLTAAPRP